jgi:hypothetical protein
MRPEHPDLILVAETFAERVAEGDWDEASHEAQLAYDVSHGSYLVTERNDGGCRVITRDARYCPFPARAGEPYCGLHARYIRAKKADA